MRGEVADQLIVLEMQKQRPPEHFHVAHIPSYVWTERLISRRPLFSPFMRQGKTPCTKQTFSRLELFFTRVVLVRKGVFKPLLHLTCQLPWETISSGCDNELRASPPRLTQSPATYHANNLGDSFSLPCRRRGKLRR